MISIFQLIQRSVVVIMVMVRFLPPILSKIWGGVKIISSFGATWAIVKFYPIIELILMALTGWKGILSPIINYWISRFFAKVLTLVTGNYSMNDSFNALGDKALQMMCWLGISAAIKTFINGLVVLAIMFINVKIAVYIIKIKANMVLGGKLK